MTLIIAAAALGAILGSVAPLYHHAVNKRAAAEEQARHDRIVNEQAAMHRAYADKLIPRFATDGAPGGEGPM